MMKTYLFMIVLPLLFVTTVGSAAGEEIKNIDLPDTNQENDYYHGNKFPLLPSPLIKLPCGAIKPQGWLRKQLELQAEGFVGHLGEISGYLRKENNAWLNPNGVGHSGWEELPYWLRGFTSLAYILGDKKLIDEACLWIENAIASQRQDGYFGTKSNLGDDKRGPDLMPNMSMMFALRTYYECTGDKRVIELLKKYFHWELTIPDKQFFASGWQVPRNGDNLDSVYWLYNRTGDKKLLELAEKLQRSGASWMNKVTGGHNVDFSQGFRKPAQYYQQSKDLKYLEASERNWESMMDIYGQVPGGMFGGDEFARAGYTDPRQAIETCGVVEMMQSQEILLRITGDVKWADRCENIAFNTLPATMTADLKGLRYLTSPNQCNSDKRSKEPELADGGPMQVMNPHDHRCCQHNVSMGWPYFVENLWMATPGNGLAAIFYCASEVRAKVGKGEEISIIENTNYPFDENIEFTINTKTPVEFPLYLRVPGWCENTRLAINGKPFFIKSKPASYIKLQRNWQDGDKVDLTLPMKVTAHTWAKNNNSTSINLGPLTFSLKIGEKYERTGGTDLWPAWEILPTTAWNYGLILNLQDLAESIKVIHRLWPQTNQPFTLETAPVELKVKAKKIPTWTEDYVGLIGKLQPSPVKSDEPVETVTLIPMGAARLRVSAFPTISDEHGAHIWSPPPEPMASFHRGGNTDPIEAINDGRIPESSYDKTIPRFTWWSWSQFGKRQWIQQNLDEETMVSSCEVYWFDESPVNADCRVPEWWRILYKDGEQWREVNNPSEYGLEVDKFNIVTFDPVKTESLRLEVQCQERRSAGIYEWRIK